MVIVARNRARNDEATIKITTRSSSMAPCDFVKDQALPCLNFKKLGEKKLTYKGLGLRQVDSSATGGGKTLNPTFLGARAAICW